MLIFVSVYNTIQTVDQHKEERFEAKKIINFHVHLKVFLCANFLLNSYEELMMISPAYLMI